MILVLNELCVRVFFVQPRRLRPTARDFFSSGLLALALLVTPSYAAQLNADEPDHSELHCVVMPSAIVDVASGVSGRVETIDVERGDKVEAGQTVAALESGVEQANLALVHKLVCTHKFFSAALR